MLEPSNEPNEPETETPVTEEIDVHPGPSGIQKPSKETVKVLTKKEKADKYMRARNLTKKSEISWRKIDKFLTSPIKWHKEGTINVNELQSPVHFFSQYFTDFLYQLMAENTNLYAVQKATRFAPTNIEELKTFVGIHILMGNLHYPRVKFYWDPQLNISQISQAMPINRFYSLRTNLHFVDVESEDINKNDRFWKVRPLFDVIRTRCLALPLETYLSIDEQMVPFKGHLNVKQYVRNKPNPWGVKIYALCGVSGTLFDFILYQGSTTEVDKGDQENLGLGAAMVMKLSERIDQRNVQLYFDNYFSNYQLLQYLRQKNIYATCTARVDRFNHPPFTADNELKKKGRGTMEQLVSGDGEVILTKWFDNKAVITASNFMGIGEPDSCRRWDKINKEFVQVKRPEVIKNYNLYMGGIDKMDFLITIYRTFIRSRKWTLRMFTHAIDIACVNAWSEYRKQASILGIEKKKVIDLLHFRSYVAEVLMKANKISTRKRGRPTSVEIPQRAPKTPAARRPLDEVRLDGINHLPVVDASYNNRCKFPQCKGKTCFRCEKCGINLCLSKKSNCFRKYHTEK